MTELLTRLKQRKLVQWLVGYAASAFAVAQGIDLFAQRFDWPDAIMRVLMIALVIGFFVALVLAWYHGERGAQRVSATELLILVLLLAIGGGFLWQFTRAPDAGRAARAATHDPDAAPPTRQPAAAPAQSVAVLPFVNMSGDPHNEYFSDGITEEILNALTQVSGLKVAARTSAFAFKGKEEDLRKVGQVLDVATVLEGSVQRVDDQVRITAQLIDTRSGYHLWSEKYDRKLTNIFAVEDEISKAIADKLRGRIAGGARSLVSEATGNPQAHDLYLRGLTLLATRSLEQAVDAFQQAVKLDPEYALAWGDLAETQVLLPGYFLAPMETALAQAEVSAKRALAIDPDTASAYVALGRMRHARWQWKDADAAFGQALALAPGDAEAVGQYALFLFAAGQFEPALREIGRAAELDPLSPVPGVSRTDILEGLHRFDEAAMQAQATVAAHPDFALAHFMAMQVAIYRQRYDEAENQARSGARLAGEDPDAYAQLVRGLADPAQRPGALRIVESAPPEGHWELGPTGTAKWLALIGAHDQALQALERFAARGEGHGEQFIWDPAFDPLRDDPRFQAVLGKMGLPYEPAGMAQ